MVIEWNIYGLYKEEVFIIIFTIILNYWTVFEKLLHLASQEINFTQFQKYVLNKFKCHQVHADEMKVEVACSGRMWSNSDIVLRGKLFEENLSDMWLRGESSNAKKLTNCGRKRSEIKGVRWKLILKKKEAVDNVVLGGDFWVIIKPRWWYCCFNMMVKS